jgi:hypothetical protein
VIADAIRGTLTILIVMMVSGVIAYVGDRVGHQVGRKRLSLFGIRPRYTSTIVAVSTGMLIALLAMLLAVIFSQQVKTALFRMNQISLQISQLEARQKQLETAQVVVSVDTLMVPYFTPIPKGTPVDKRLQLIRAFYNQAVAFMNQTYVPQGLKRFIPPSDVDAKIRNEFATSQVSEASLHAKLLVYVTSDQNLYRGDEIHFQLGILDDLQRLQAGQLIVAEDIPQGKNIDLNLALGGLQQLVSNIARSQEGLALPPFLANNVRVLAGSPSATQMQAMLNAKGNGRLRLAAYAAEDIYPHTGGIPITVTLTKI